MRALVHLHLTFAGFVCILSLKGRQEHCLFTTRLRVLKLEKNPQERFPDITSFAIALASF